MENIDLNNFTSYNIVRMNHFCGMNIRIKEEKELIKKTLIKKTVTGNILGGNQSG